MSISNEGNKTHINYPKVDISKNFFISKSSLHNQVELNNPSINHFSIDSFFIYDQIDSFKFFESLTDKNKIKLNQSEISFLTEIYNQIKIFKGIKEGDKIISLDSKVYDSIMSYFKIDIPKSHLSKFLEGKILNTKNRAKLSCRKLANEYFTETGIKVGKSTVNNKIRNELGFHYLKTTLKRNSIKKASGILGNFTFIKIFTRCLKLGFTPIFLDETKIELNNNHYKIWRFTHEQLCFNNFSKDKSNLLLAVGKDRVYASKITKENTNSSNFLEFLKILSVELSKRGEKKYVLIMDNLPAHKADNVIDFLKKNEICTIFNIPYMSNFNAIELSFRSIKKITYTNLYNSIDEVNEDVSKFLLSKEINDTLLLNYKETINQYILFFEKNKDINLNNFYFTE